MAPMHAVSFAETAVRDLEELQLWYTAQGAADVGARLVSDVMERVEQLARFPQSGRVVPEFGVPWLRELILAPFRIVYRLDDARVRIVRVWRSERLMREL